MGSNKNFIQRFFLGDEEFKPYYEKENSFHRILILHGIAALFIAPVYSYFIRFVGVDEIYSYFGISYTILFPIYALICWYIPYLKDKLVYFTIGHYFAITYFAFNHLLLTEFATPELIMFIVTFSIGLALIQRWYPAILYNVFVFLLMLYGFMQFQDIGIPKLMISTLFITLSSVSMVVLYARTRILRNIESHTIYLKRLMNNTGAGYVLFKVKDTLEILDNNEEVCKLLNVNQDKLEPWMYKQFNKEELAQLRSLQVGKKFTKNSHFFKYGIKYYLEIHVSVIRLKSKLYLLARISDISGEVSKREELELSEKRYKNLYYKNKAGVFTIDENSIILNGNEAFFEMFENTVQTGDRLFPVSLIEDWELILDSFGEKESSKNYQTQFKLSNGTEKTLIFSWYFDTQSNNIEGSVIDLTSIQQTSRALMQSEEKYRLIYEESNDAILLLDEDQIINVNRKAIQLFGQPRNQLLEMNLFDLSANSDKESREAYDAHKQKLSNTRSTKFDWLFTGNNRLIEGEVTFIEIMFENKVYYQCVIQDNTELNKNIRAIQSNQRNLENILESNPEGIVIVRDGKVLYANTEFNNLVGKNFNFNKLFTEDDQVKFERCLEEHYTSNMRQNVQLTLINQSKEALSMDVTLVSTNYEEEKATLIIMKDVSVQTTLAKEKLRAELAEESNKKLAKEIMDRIRAEKLLEEQYLRTKAILDSSSNTFLLTLTLQQEISSFNTHCESYFETNFKKKIKKKVHLNKYFENIISPVRLRLFNIQFAGAKKGKSRQFEVKMENKGREYWLEIFMNPIFDTEGAVSEISLVAHDISEKKKSSIEIEESLKEKEVLLKEIHHRVKNNLQVISSILNLQSSFVDDEKTLGILQESRNRIRSMAIIHENLYRTEDFSSINFSGYLDNLTSNLFSSYRIDQRVTLKSELQDVDLVLDQAIPCGLLVNELVTNALKYAWKDGEEGVIKIKLTEKNKKISLEISDNGIGLPFDFSEMKSDTLGLQLVVTLVEQLDGEIKVTNKNGTKYLIKFDSIKPHS